MDTFVPSLPASLWLDFADMDSDKCCTMQKRNFFNKLAHLINSSLKVASFKVAHLSNIQTCLIDPLEFLSTWNAWNVAEIECLFGKL